MENLEAEIKSICQLLNSWQDENIELAFQILEGNSELDNAVKLIYQPLFDFSGFDWELGYFMELPIGLSNADSNGGIKDIPYSEALAEIIAIMPVDSVDYSNLGFKNFPWWLFYFRQLETLYLSENQIEEIPIEILRLEKLQILDLNNNRIKVIPDFIGQISTLIRLQLDFNEIETVPDSIGDLFNLKWLCLEANKITALPETALDLISLNWLSIEGTPLAKKHGISSGLYTSTGSEIFQKLVG